MRRITATLFAVPLMAVALHAQSPALDSAVAAMGGRDRLLAIRTLVIEGTGENLNFGQNHTPMAETKFEVSAFRRYYDFANRRWFQDQTRVPRFPTANTSPQRLRFGLDGAAQPVAWNIGNTDVMSRASAAVAADRMNELVFHPIGFVMAAHAAGTQVIEEPAGPDARRVRINPAGITYAALVLISIASLFVAIPSARRHLATTQEQRNRMFRQEAQREREAQERRAAQARRAETPERTRP